MAFGIPKIGELTAQLDERFKQLIAKLDEILDELRAQNRNERGAAGWVTLAVIGFFILLLVGGFAFCDLLIDDESEPGDEHFLGRVELVSHDYDDGWDEGGGGQDYEDNWGGEDRNRNRGRNRGSFSPGPFDDSPIDMRNACISLDCSGREPSRDEQPPPEGGN